MSDNILALTNQKKNEIEFELEVDGLTVAPSNIRFIIETSEMEYAFNCTKKKGKVYKVTVPPLPQLEKTLYPFRIEAVIDGYHFIPMEGQINVSGSFEVYASNTKNTTVAPPKKTAVKAEKQKDAKPEEKDIAALAKKVLGKKDSATKSTVKKTTAKKAPAKKEEQEKPVVKKSAPRKAAKKVEPKKTVKEVKTAIDLVNVEADNLVKDAIQTLRENVSSIKPKPVPKTDRKPFFKKVTGKKKCVVEEPEKVAPVVDPKDIKVQAILEADETVSAPTEPVVTFKKGKRVKN